MTRMPADQSWSLRPHDPLGGILTILGLCFLVLPVAVVGDPQDILSPGGEGFMAEAGSYIFVFWNSTLPATWAPEQVQLAANANLSLAIVSCPDAVVAVRFRWHNDTVLLAQVPAHSLLTLCPSAPCACQPPLALALALAALPVHSVHSVHCQLLPPSDSLVPVSCPDASSRWYCLFPRTTIATPTSPHRRSQALGRTRRAHGAF